jgi:hypothetical protein
LAGAVRATTAVGLAGWPFGLTASNRRLGVCKHRREWIVISEYCVRYNPDVAVLDHPAWDRPHPRRGITAQAAPELNQAKRQKLAQVAADLSAAQKSGDEACVKESAKWAVELLGDQTGLPETADEFRRVATDAKPLAPDELATAFDQYTRHIAKQKW